MKILVIGRQFPDSFARNISETFSDMGHEVFTYEESRLFPRLHKVTSLGQGRILRDIESSLIRGSTKIEAMVHGSLLKLIAKIEPDFILNTYNSIPPWVIKDIKNTTAAKIALWFPDAIINLGRQYVLSSSYDALFFKEPYIVRMLREKMELPAYYLPECCNPRWHHKVDISLKDQEIYGCDLTTAGNIYPWKEGILSQFKDYDFRIWGDYFPHWLDSSLRSKFQNHYVSELEKAKAFNAAKIVINTMHYAEIEGLNCRLFEAAGCGAFQITDWKESLPELFYPDKEIVVYRTKRELKKLVDYYLAHPEERASIAEASYERAHRDHTYLNRLKKMMETLGFFSNIS